MKKIYNRLLESKRNEISDAVIILILVIGSAVILSITNKINLVLMVIIAIALISVIINLVLAILDYKLTVKEIKLDIEKRKQSVPTLDEQSLIDLTNKISNTVIDEMKNQENK